MKPRAPGARRRAHALVRAATALAAGWLLASTSLAADPRAAQFYESALARYDKKDLAGAVIELKNALQHDTRFLPVHVLLGRVLLAQGQAAAAEVSFNEALSLGVSRSEVVVALARALVAQGKQPEVVDAQRMPVDGLPPGVQAQLLLVKAAASGDLGDTRAALKAIEQARPLLPPGSAESWQAEVPVRIRARQFKEAQAALEQARRLAPQDPGVLVQQASLLHVQGQLGAALEAYNKALQADPALVDALVARAGLFIDLKRFDAAAQDVAVLTRDAAVEPRGWYLAAVLAQRDGKAQSVREAYKKITELIDPVPIGVIRYRPQLLMLNGQAHLGLGEPEKAMPYFETFLRLQPATPVAKVLATIYVGQGNIDRAIDTLEHYLRAMPQDAQGTALLASFYMSKGRGARAAELMERALRTRDDAQLHTAYGLSLLGTGQGGDALRQLEAAYRKDPDQTQAGAALVPLYLRAGQPAKALAVADALCKRQPASGGFHNLLGMAKAQARDLPGARAAYLQAIKLGPSLVQARLNLARLEVAAGALDPATALLDEAIRVDPNHTEAMLEQAMLAERRGKSDDTLRWLQRAYDVGGSKDLRASLALVDYQMRTGRTADALKAVKSLHAAAPDSLPVLLALARVQLRNAEAAGARSTLAIAGRLAPFEAPVQVEIALLQLAAQDLPGAAYSLDKALEAKPDDLRAMTVRTEVDIRRGELDKADARAQLIARREPKRAIGTSLLGDVAMARGRTDAALEQYRRAYQLEPSTDTVARLFRAQAERDPAGAATVARQWLAKHPKDATMRRQLAEQRVRRGDLAGARAEFELMHQQAPKDPGVLNDLANVLLRQGDAQAGARAEQALALAPTDPNVMDTAGWAALQGGKIDRAIQLLRDARLRDPENPGIRFHLAAALAKSGRNAEARDELTWAIASKFTFDDRREAETLMATLK